MKQENNMKLSGLALTGVCVVVAVAAGAAVLGVYQQSRISGLVTSNTNLSREVNQLTANQDALSAAQKTRQSATTASLGVCTDYQTETLDNYSPPVTVITGVQVTSPSLTSGVTSCPSGTFVPVAPQPGG